MRIAKYVAIAPVLILSVIAVTCGSGSDSGDTPTSSGVSGAQSNPADAPAEEYRPYPVDDTDFSVHAERLNTCRGELGMPG